jgi:hypothetical protein
MESSDWAKLDEEYQLYCHQCQAEGKPPVDFHTWLLGED